MFNKNNNLFFNNYLLLYVSDYNSKSIIIYFPSVYYAIKNKYNTPDLSKYNSCITESNIMKMISFIMMKMEMIMLIAIMFIISIIIIKIIIIIIFMIIIIIIIIVIIVFMIIIIVIIFI